MVDDSILALRRQLANEIVHISEQTDMYGASRVLGIDMPRLSDLRHGRVQRFSLERLIRMLATIDRRVDVTIVNIGPAQVRWHQKMRENLRRRRSAPDGRGRAPASRHFR